MGSQENITYNISDAKKGLIIGLNILIAAIVLSCAVTYYFTNKRSDKLKQDLIYAIAIDKKITNVGDFIITKTRDGKTLISIEGE